ncbi:MAG: hypothetical protein OEQ25_10080 [Gammaproteobacteria bacterium]|nr:hypothetical protein [Gammaproteobacteria bacterium]MDH3507474.1 hypothetical protein [Gammaproteobacteria bacterium]
MNLHPTVIALGMSVALFSLPVTVSGQEGGSEPVTAPWPPIQLPDGQPDVQGAWRPVNGGTQSLERAMSSGDFFRELMGEDIPEHPSRIVDPEDGRVPYQPWARALQQELEAVYQNPTRPEHIDTQTRCLGPGVPRLYYFPRYRILQPPGSVVFVWDQYHSYRVIPLDGRPHISPRIKLWSGDGRGRWEGNTLIVDTTNLNGKSRLDVIGDFFSDQAHVEERFIFIDGSTMHYEATITDPTVFTRPWTMRVVQRRQPEEEFWEFACHEGERDADSTSRQFGD